MKIHIITLFPDAFTSFFQHSIIARAKEKKLFSVVLYNLCDFSTRPTRRVDEKAYGMHGQVLSPEPLGNAIEAVFEKNGKKFPVIHMTPRGQKLSQEWAEKFSDKKYGDILIICGHYEGIDERVIEKYVDYELSIGEYILSGGELGAQVFIDVLLRHIPGVLGNPQSLEEESFSQKLERKKEYPIYTRPEIWENLSVPEVLRSGDHKKIEEWKRKNLK